LKMRKGSISETSAIQFTLTNSIPLANFVCISSVWILCLDAF
jgi:hypothetical protein